MKKGVEIAFAIALIILAIISTVFPTELTESIIYAVVIPSFILSLISFVSEISELCENNAEKLSDLEKKVSDNAHKFAESRLKLYNEGLHEQPFVEGFVPDEIHEHEEASVNYLKKAVISKDVQVFCIKCKRVCHKLTISGYVLLFLSLFLSPCIAKCLSVVDLNCITLWSLALLYVTLELKSECCNWLFGVLYKKYSKKVEDSLNNETGTDSL